MLDFQKSIYCVITGASRGIGRQIAQNIAQKTLNSNQKITFVLLARNEKKLNETKKYITDINKNAVVHCAPLDLSAATESDDASFRLLLARGEPETHDVAVVFHNAGSIGKIGRVVSLRDYSTWKNYYNLNVFSVTCLNSVFLDLVQNIPLKIVVNVTSLVGRKAFKYLSMYGSGKAARDMYFKVLALEEPQVRVLNYSPGMVETSMATELVENINNGGYEDSEIAIAVKENPTKLTPNQTVTKLMDILEQGSFKSGDIIDYYD